jgi:alkylated DNA repair dioxygenase AlkB
MVFKNRSTSDTQDVYVEDGSLYIMSGPARWNWTHEIKGLKTDIIDGKRVKRNTRISITFRSNNEDTSNVFE